MWRVENDALTNSEAPLVIAAEMRALEQAAEVSGTTEDALRSDGL